MIKDLGNCGNPQKLERIMKAVKSAQENKCCLIVCGKNSLRITSENIQKISFAQHNDELLIIRDSKVIAIFTWWDISKIEVIW